MKKGYWIYGFFGSLIVVSISSLVFGAAESTAATAVTLAPGAADFFTKSVVVASSGLVIVAVAGALSQMFSIRKALEGIARQPEAGAQLQLSMIIGLAFIESLVLYVLFISIILLFANPFTKYFIQ
ncbi:MAG: hypothetical protein A2539_03960 [Elusimicrobia bacterium RIFOXYD2_FULL_34_15]|nr:MAG: hypothetical protein A2539_03960 [Elusimicrobia bacterium RIFOXYD2_FULL_34_15]